MSPQLPGPSAAAHPESTKLSQHSEERNSVEYIILETLFVCLVLLSITAHACKQGKRVVEVAASKRHTVTRTADGDLWTWGHCGVSPRRVLLGGARDTQRASGAEVLLSRSAVPLSCSPSGIVICMLQGAQICFRLELITREMLSLKSTAQLPSISQQLPRRPLSDSGR